MKRIILAVVTALALAVSVSACSEPAPSASAGGGYTGSVSSIVDDPLNSNTGSTYTALTCGSNLVPVELSSGEVSSVDGRLITTRDVPSTVMPAEQASFQLKIKLGKTESMPYLIVHGHQGSSIDPVLTATDHQMDVGITAGGSATYSIETSRYYRFIPEGSRIVGVTMCMYRLTPVLPTSTTPMTTSPTTHVSVTN